MVVYSFYIFDRHTECIYTKKWVPQPPDRPISSSHNNNDTLLPTSSSSGIIPLSQAPTAPAPTAPSAPPRKPRKDNDAKLIFGTVFQLRHMARKLGGDDDAFISYRTGQYKLHFYETPSSLRFVMLTDTGVMSMRNVLHQIYINLWVEYVVKNPLSPVEHPGGEGVKNELFELGLDQFVRGLM